MLRVFDAISAIPASDIGVRFLDIDFNPLFYHNGSSSISVIMIKDSITYHTGVRPTYTDADFKDSYVLKLMLYSKYESIIIPTSIFDLFSINREYIKTLPGSLFILPGSLFICISKNNLFVDSI